jgi:hypothetical protein
MKKQTKKNQQCSNTIAGFSINTIKTNTSKASIMINVNEYVITRQEKTKNTNPILNNLLLQCRTNREKKVLLLLWETQGILTHDLSDKYGCKSNNHHLITRDLNPRLILRGWVITKYHEGKKQKSWRWFIEPVHLALSNPIRKDLRRTILKNMVAAND